MFLCGRIGHRREHCPYIVRKDIPQAKEAEEKEDTLVSHGDVGRGSDIPGTSTNTSKDSGVHEEKMGEDTLVDNAKDMYGPWIMVSRRRSGSKATKKVDPIDSSSPRMKGEGKLGLNQAVQREGKRKVNSVINTLEAQMANVVQSITNGLNHTNKSPSQHHVEKNGPKAESSLSVRGKKGIARNRMSLSATNRGVVNGAATGEIASAKPSFLDNLSVNGNATFNFKANSCGHSTSISTNDHQSRTNHGERQPSVQVIMAAQESSDMVEGGDDGSSQSKVYSDGVEQIAEFQF